MEPLIIFFIILLIGLKLHDRRMERDNRRSLVLPTVVIISLIVRRERQRKVLAERERSFGPTWLR
jgi:hypothetical protein